LILLVCIGLAFACAAMWRAGAWKLFHPFRGRAFLLRLRPAPGTEERQRLVSSAVFHFVSRAKGPLQRSKRSNEVDAIGAVRVVRVGAEGAAGHDLVGVLRNPNISYLYGKPPLLWVYRADATGKPLARALADREGTPEAIRRFLRSSLEAGRLGLTGPEWLPDRPVRVGDTWKIERLVEIEDARRIQTADLRLVDVFEKDGHLRAKIRGAYSEDVRSPWSSFRPEHGEREIVIDLTRGVAVSERTTGTVRSVTGRRPMTAEFELHTGLESLDTLSPEDSARHAQRLRAVDRALERVAANELDAAVRELTALMKQETDEAWWHGMYELRRAVDLLRRQASPPTEEKAPVPAGKK